MNNMLYLRDIINYESAYQGVISPKTKTNFYSLCAKVFHKTQDGQNSISRTEIYKMIEFDDSNFADFFERINDQSQYVNELFEMLKDPNTQRKLNIEFFGYVYKKTETSQDNIKGFKTTFTPCSLNLYFEKVDEWNYDISIELVDINNDTITLSAGDRVVGDLIFTAEGTFMF